LEENGLEEKVLRRALNASGHKPSFAMGHPTKANKFKSFVDLPFLALRRFVDSQKPHLWPMRERRTFFL
jgi:hypothetical protein